MKKNVVTNKVFITSQNHNYVIKLSGELEVTHLSLFDNTIQGFKHRELPIWGFQGHPEGGPGPSDVDIFDCIRDFM